MVVYNGESMKNKSEQIIKEYQTNLDKCKEYRKKYLLIDNGKEIIENFNARLIPHFNGYKDPYVNETLKFLKLITDLDVVNQNIIESHEIWKIIKETEGFDIELQVYNTYKYKRLSKLHEYIVFDLKHFIDEIIATISIIRGFVKNDKVTVSSIGAYLSKKQSEFNDFDSFIELFQILDDLANSYKHSYANSDLSVIGREEDCFVALYSQYNDFNNNPTPFVISINDVVDNFNKFYKFSFNLIDRLTRNKRTMS